MMLDVFIDVSDATWASAAPTEIVPNTWSQSYNDALRYEWVRPVRHTLGTAPQISALLAQLGNPPAYAWIQGSGDAVLDPPVDVVPPEFLALLPAEMAGDISLIPVFLGQREGGRLLDGYFSDDFSEDFF